MLLVQQPRGQLAERRVAVLEGRRRWWLGGFAALERRLDGRVPRLVLRGGCRRRILIDEPFCACVCMCLKLRARGEMRIGGMECVNMSWMQVL